MSSRDQCRVRLQDNEMLKKGKNFPVHSMKKRGRSGGIAPLIHRIGTRWR